MFLLKVQVLAARGKRRNEVEISALHLPALSLKEQGRKTAENLFRTDVLCLPPGMQKQEAPEVFTPRA